MTEEPKSEQTLDARLDEALEMTFPASDPIAVHASDPRAATRPPPATHPLNGASEAKP